MRSRKILALFPIPIMFLIGCTDASEPVFPLQIEATQFFEKNRAGLSALADKLESDTDIHSITCFVGGGQPGRIEAEVGPDLSAVYLEGERADLYLALIKNANICDGGAVLGGVIFHLYEIDAPSYTQSIGLLRADREGDSICGTEYISELSSMSCVLPLDDEWKISFTWSLKW